MKKSILVIDDSPFVLNQMKKITNHTEYEVVGHARAGEEGLAMYKELNPNIVTLDIIMPGIDGIETAKEILQEDSNANILMLSSVCDADTLKEVKKIGVNYLLSKPIEPDLLLSTFELFNI